MSTKEINRQPPQSWEENIDFFRLYFSMENFNEGYNQ